MFLFLCDQKLGESQFSPTQSDKISNKEVLAHVNEMRTVLNTIRKATFKLLSQVSGKLQLIIKQSVRQFIGLVCNTSALIHTVTNTACCPDLTKIKNTICVVKNLLQQPRLFRVILQLIN